MTVLPFRIRWAEVLITNGEAIGDVPEYGSAEWASLEDDDRRKVAATVIAAERWRTRDQRDQGFLEPVDNRTRRIRAARRPRPNDFAGGRVHWQDGGVAQ
jgi:microcystin degradation protein MlrC